MSLIYSLIGLLHVLPRCPKPKVWSVHALAHLHIYKQRAFEQKNKTRSVPSFLSKFLFKFGTISQHPAMHFPARGTESDGVCSGSWPLRCLTGVLVSRCSPPHSLPCPSAPNLMISNGHQANHSITHTAVYFPCSLLHQRAKEIPRLYKCHCHFCLFVCLTNG